MYDARAVLRHLRSQAYAGFTRRVRPELGGVLAFLPPQQPLPPEEPILRDRNALPVSGLVRAPEGLFFGVVRQGRVVSWAVAGRERDGLRLITLETDRQYRGQGLARQALLALCAQTSEPLLYLCAPANAASRRAAEKAGFTLLGQAFPNKR